MIRILSVLVISALPCLIGSTAIDNGVEGDPEIECAANSITVNLNTKNEFNGHVYVKGRFAEQECRSDQGGGRVTGIKLEFTSCGTKRERSLTPKGVAVWNTVVITFHPQFLTKVDRAYTVQCFYMEADKTVSQDLEVSEITTQFQTEVVPMPVCIYEILDGGPAGQSVKFATIGQQVYHKWSCQTETVDIFCALIHSCFVDDGAGNNVELLNEQGCALDKFLLGNLEYQSDLTAGHEAHVFKYADKPALFFQCQISITVKEPGQQCNRPLCPELGGPEGTAPPRASRPLAGPISPAPPRASTGSPPSSPIAVRPELPFKFRYARAVQQETSEPVGTWDVTARPITAIDIQVDYNTPLSSLNSHQSHSPGSYCLSLASFGIMAAFMIVSVLIFFSCVRRIGKL